MLRCQPKGFFSWDYQITRNDRYEATLGFTTFREQAGFDVRGQRYEISKDGFLSSRWTLLQNGRGIARASKPNPFTRRFEIVSDVVSFELVAASLFTRRFEFVHNSRGVGTLAPVHAFTRRAEIDCDPMIPVELQVFCLALAVFVWRRAARNNN